MEKLAIVLTFNVQNWKLLQWLTQSSKTSIEKVWIPDSRGLLLAPNTHRTHNERLLLSTIYLHINISLPEPSYHKPDAPHQKAKSSSFNTKRRTKSGYQVIENCPETIPIPTPYIIIHTVPLTITNSATYFPSRLLTPLKVKGCWCVTWYLSPAHAPASLKGSDPHTFDSDSTELSEL